MNLSHSVALQVGFFVFVAGIIIVGTIAQRRRKQAMDAYALAHGWNKIDVNDSSIGAFVPQRIFGQGDRHSYAMGYQLNVNARPAYLFEYTNTTDTTNSDGSTSTTSQHYTVLAFELAGLTPIQIVKKSLFNKLEAIGKRTDSLQVEGDFNKHFDVLIPGHGQIVALTILTPDTMALIEDMGTNFNIQIQANLVIIFGDDKYISADKIEILTAYAAKLEPELAQKLHQIAPLPEPVISPTTATIFN